MGEEGLFMANPITNILPESYDESLSYYEQVREVAVTVNEVIEEINTIDGSITDIESSVSSLTTRVTTVEGDVGDLNTTVTSLTSRVTAVEGEVDTLNTDMTGVKSDITSIESDLTTAKSDISTIKGQITTINSSISTLQDDLDALENTQSTDYNELNGKITALTTRVTTLEGTVKTLDTTVDNLSQQVAGFNTRLNNVEESVEDLEIANNRRTGNVWSNTTKNFPYNSVITNSVKKTIISNDGLKPTSGTLTVTCGGSSQLAAGSVPIPDDFEIGWFIVFEYDTYTLVNQQSGVLAITAKVYLDNQKPTIYTLPVPRTLGTPTAGTKSVSISASNTANIIVTELIKV